VSVPQFAMQIGNVRPIGGGMYEDDGQQLHVHIPEFLQSHGYADTRENRDAAIIAAHTALKRRFPNLPVVVTTDNGQQN